MIVLFLVDVGATSGQGFGQGFTVLDAAKYTVEYFVKVRWRKESWIFVFLPDEPAAVTFL